MKLKAAGKLNAPPSQADFDAVPLEAFCRIESGVFHRLHSSNPITGDAWPAVHFSVMGTTRFDPAGGRGTLYLARKLGGAIMEVFDDRWGPVGSLGRSLSQSELQQWWVTLLNIPPVKLFDATGSHLSKIGTDAQLLTGDYVTSQIWALRLMQHPAAIDGIYFASRHDPRQWNVALFRSSTLLPEVKSITLLCDNPKTWKPSVAQKLHFGPAVRLGSHPRLKTELRRLQVALLP